MANLPTKTKYIILVCCSLFFTSLFYGQTDNAPEITAQGNEAFCIGTSKKIVTDFSITDLDDTGIAFFYIQVSEGYQVNADILKLAGTHLNIVASWNASEGKLTLSSSTSGAEIPFLDLEKAVKEVVFETTAVNVTDAKVFSLTIDDANYLPKTAHFYEFIPAIGITWSAARSAAETRTYYGRQGYLATLISQEEADFAGKQAAGAGWIGGSDAETPNVWKWVTGPEAGSVFWNGSVNGSSPNFAFWNTNEPNNFGNRSEDYVHITAAGVGIAGSWNDLTNTGDVSGDFQPKGYIVEYGAPGDAPLNIVATTRLFIPKITNTVAATICESGTATISANAVAGEIIWFDAIIGGTELARGENFTTPNISATTTYYAMVAIDACLSSPRTAVTVRVLQKPIITNTSNDLICAGSANLSAVASSGTVMWYATATSITPLFIGNNFQTPNLTTSTTYFVGADNATCTTLNRVAVTANVENTIPIFNVAQETYVLCKDIGSVTIEVIDFSENYNYIWSRNSEVLIENTAEIRINEPGVYKVKAISNAGCASEEQIITVRNSQIAVLTKENSIIKDASIEIVRESLGTGVYEFSLDNEFSGYQEDAVFSNISAGVHTLFVRDTEGCGTQAYRFSILKYPTFFTPNNDGVNDLWNINGFDKDFYTLSTTFIFNRFGVLVYKITQNSAGWDGTYGGRKLAANSYWFKTTLTDVNGLSVEKSGNFSLIRK